MKVTVLGCGCSGGVPLIGNDWGACDPANPRNRRLRPSLLVEDGDFRLLVDTTPDARQQLLAHEVRHLSAVLYTHAHADHTHGIDDLRSVNWLTGQPLPIYADAETMQSLQQRFDYIFAPRNGSSFTRPTVEPHVINGEMSFGSIRVTSFRQAHGPSHSIGFRFNDFAYSTDVSDLNDAAFKALEGVKVWMVDSVREKPHPTRAHVAKALEWIERVKPVRAFLTHMNQTLDYETLCQKLPAHVRPAHDGLVIEF